MRVVYIFVHHYKYRNIFIYHYIYVNIIVYIYIIVHIYIFIDTDIDIDIDIDIYAQRLGFAQALQRRGSAFPIKCCCNFTLNWEDQKELAKIGIRPPLNSTFHWEDQRRY